jgi:hypothetical protein
VGGYLSRRVGAGGGWLDGWVGNGEDGWVG